MKRSRTLVLMLSALVGQLSAEGGETFDRLGRLWGYGWSDGYHACSADDFRLGENLPPHSFAASVPRTAVSPHYGGVSGLGFRSTGHCDESFIDGGAHWPIVPAEPEHVVTPPAAAALALPPSPRKAAESLPSPQPQPVPAIQGNLGSRFPRKLSMAAPVLESAQRSLPVSGLIEAPSGSASPRRLPLTDRAER